MKVVLFCGGLGTRMREHSGTIPKPLVTIGPHPIVWQLMRYYAHFGHTEFVLCLGYGGDLIRSFFEREARGHEGWNIHFLDTGLHASIGERLRASAPYVQGDELFLANYSDGLSDLPLDMYLDAFRKQDAVAGFAAVRMSQSYHMVAMDPAGRVTALTKAEDANVWINGGYFVLRPEIFNYLEPGDELVEAPFKRLMDERRLYSYKYEGFWASVDTYKDKVRLDHRYDCGDAPWAVWK